MYMKCSAQNCFFSFQGIFVLSTITYSELDYRRPTGVYKYPDWAVGVGWAMASFAAVFIPGMAVYNVLYAWIKGEV